MTPLQKSSELERIRWIRDTLARAAAATPAAFTTWMGPGDDAAAWLPPPSCGVVATVDAQIEDTHFRRSWLSPRSLGRRAVAAAASDLAAMAAEPAGILCALSLPGDYGDDDFRALFEGIAAEAASAGLTVFGGNLTRGPLGITTTAFGHAAKDDIIGRSGAAPGDAIFVTGSPGRSRIGREVLCRDPAGSAAGAPGDGGGGGAARRCIDAYRHPRARIPEALALRRSFRPSALIDLSDGLAQDLGHILAESAAATPLGAVLDAAAVLAALDGDDGPARAPAGDTPGALARRLGLDPLEAALDGGEDFELVWTARPDTAARLEAAGRIAGTPLRRIGEVRAGAGVAVRPPDGGAARAWTGRGHDHFSSGRS